MLFTAWNINLAKRIFIRKSIEKGLKKSSSFYYKLLEKGLIKVIPN